MYTIPITLTPWAMLAEDLQVHGGQHLLPIRVVHSSFQTFSNRQPECSPTWICVLCNKGPSESLLFLEGRYQWLDLDAFGLFLNRCQQTSGSLQVFLKPKSSQSTWWWNQPIWKMFLPKWVHLPPGSGWKYEKYLSCHHWSVNGLVKWFTPKIPTLSAQTWSVDIRHEALTNWTYFSIPNAQCR